ncbi:MAG: NAD(P)-binding protein [Arenicella sp.]|nr:NAD(P)-binding protein [Arenicella sp.]
MRILIAGAGISGLTATLCLLRAEHDVHLVEQASQFSEFGGGLQCGAKAVRVFDYLGILPVLESVSIAAV